MDNFKHKNVNIYVDEKGMFCFSIGENFYSYTTLKEAKLNVDKLTKDYYTFTQVDMKKMFSKLNNREREFIKSLCNEIDIHRNNAYCSLGICDENWDWDWQFND